MSDSFAPDSGFSLTTATFDIRYPNAPEGGQRSRRAGSLISVRPLPYGGSAVIQSGGVGPRTLSYTLYVASETELEHLEAARGYHGTLTTTIDGTLGATLQDCDASEWWPGGSQHVAATFVLDS